MNIIIKLVFIELFYKFSIQLFSTFDEINIDDIQLSNIRNYIDKIIKFIFITKDNHIIIKIIQIYNINKSQYSDLIYKIKDMIILNSRNIYYHIKKNDYLIKFYSHFLDLFKIIKMKLSISNYKLKLLLKIDFILIHLNFHFNLL